MRNALTTPGTSSVSNPTHPSNGAISGMVLEGILTYLLMFVIMAVATDTRAVRQAGPWQSGVRWHSKPSSRAQ